MGKPLRLLPLVLVLAQCSSHAQQEGASVFDSVGDWMSSPAFERQQVRRLDDSTTPDLVAPDLENPRVKTLLRTARPADVRFAVFDVETLRKAHLRDTGEMTTISSEGALAEIPISDLAVTEDSEGITTATARVGVRGDGNLVLVVEGGRALGVLQLADTVYFIKHMYGRWHAIVAANETTSGRMSEGDVVDLDDADGSNADEATGGGPTPDAACDLLPPTATIDLVVGYTPRARVESTAQVVDIETQILLASEVSNMTFGKSRVAASFRVLGISEVEYTEQGAPHYFRADIRSFKRGEGRLGDLLAARRDLKADVGVLVVHDDNPSRCGIAGGIGVGKSNALAVVNWMCMSNKFSYAHEIGHLAGARHDDDPNLPEYAHGFLGEQVNPPVKFGTIMATQSSCITSGCGRIWNWSNPRVKHKAVATGTLQKNDNACVWNRNAARLAAFDGG